MGEHSKTGRGHVNKYGAKIKKTLKYRILPKGNLTSHPTSLIIQKEQERIHAAQQSYRI